MIQRLTQFVGGITGWYNQGGGNYYDSLVSYGLRRNRLQTKIRSSDEKLYDPDRRRMSGKSAMVVDNFSVAAWMVRTHINYVASINFQATTANETFNADLETWMTEWSKRLNCHAQKKHGLRDLIRLIEGRRTVDGDVFILKIGGTSVQRGSLQVIESDRIKTPDDNQPDGTRVDSTLWTNGVKLSPSGIAQSYALHKRHPDGTLTYEADLQAVNVIQHGFFDRIDQVRGVSPFVAALNTLQDLYEGFDYVLGKWKLVQLLGGTVISDATKARDMGASPRADRDGDGIPESDYDLSLSKGPKLMPLPEGSEFHVVEDLMHTDESISCLEMMTQVCLKSLDLPYSFFREDFSNWFGSRAAQNHFERAARPKRMQLIDVVNEITKWAIGMAIVDGQLALPGGMEFDDITWEWVPDGMGWYDPVAQITAYRAAIAAGLDSVDRICREVGTDPIKNLKDRARHEKLAAELELVGGVDFSMGSSSSVQLIKPAEDSQTEDQADGGVAVAEDVPDEEVGDENQDDENN